MAVAGAVVVWPATATRQDDEDEDDEQDDWVYYPDERVYRRASGGNALVLATLLGLRDGYLDDRGQVTDELAQQLADGERTIQAWQEAMQARIQETQTAAYLLGRGGRNAASPGDLADIGDITHGQWTHLYDFAAEIAAGTLTLAMVQARARHYMAAGVLGHARGFAGQYPTLVLPAYPGDGSTNCRGNCRCAWEIAEFEDRWEATWFSVGDKRECTQCEERSHSWAPYVVRK